MIESIKDCGECEFCERSYYESDTGYSEYECTLDGKGCCGGEGCPLSFKYEIVKEAIMITCDDCGKELPVKVRVTSGKNGDEHLCEECMIKRRKKEKAASDGNR